MKPSTDRRASAPVRKRTQDGTMAARAAGGNSEAAGPSGLVRINRRAHPEHNTKQIWRELNMPTDCDFLGPNVFSLPEKLLRHSTKMRPSPLARPKPDRNADKKSRNYYQTLIWL